MKASIKVKQNIFILTKSVNAYHNQVSNHTVYTLPFVFQNTVIESASSTLEEIQIYD